MKTVILESLSLGDDIDLEKFKDFGDVEIFPVTRGMDIEAKIKGCDVIVVNKTKLNESNLKNCKSLKLICVTATGYDNIDVDYCKKRNIAVCNVPAYSTYSVSQYTVATVLYLATNLGQFRNTTVTYEYQSGTVPNILKPVYHEICKKTWGIIGYGNIGKCVGNIARAMGCNVVYYKKHPDDSDECKTLDELLKISDIITIHIPLCDETRNLINSDKINMMKDGVILVNSARGAVTDEKAIADGVKSGKIGALGVDVFSEEPLSKNNPLSQIAHFDNVCLTPHMAWGAYEARERCMEVVYKNIVSFFNDEKINRVD